MAAFGILFWVLIIAVGPGPIMNLIASYGLYNYALWNGDELRHTALNLTEYDGGDDFTWALVVAREMADIRYVYPNPNDQLQSFNETWMYGGDCKNQAVLYTATLYSLGVLAEPSCSLAHQHCVTKIKNRFVDTYMIVDLTIDMFYVFPESVDDHWNNMDKKIYGGKINKKK